MDTSEGTAVEAGSQVDELNAGSTEGAEGAGTAQEPMVEIGGRQVPLSIAERALKNDERFTQKSQELADKERDIARRAQEAEAAALAAQQTQKLQRALENPDILEAVATVDPELAQTLPTPREAVDTRLLAENLQLRFDAFTMKHPEYNTEQQAGIRAEMYRLAKAGRLDDALDFDNIGLRLYRDDIIDFEAKRRIAEKEKERKAKELAARQASTAPPGMPNVVPSGDMSKLRGASLMAAAHRANNTSK